MKWRESNRIKRTTCLWNLEDLYACVSTWMTSLTMSTLFVLFVRIDEQVTTFLLEFPELYTIGPMIPYTPLNIANIHNIDLIHAIPLNIFWLLLISMNFVYPLNICQPPLPSTHSYNPALISTNSDNPHPISNIWQRPFTLVKSCQPPLIPATP